MLLAAKRYKNHPNRWVRVVRHLKNVVPGLAITNDQIRQKHRGQEMIYTRRVKHNDKSGNNPVLIEEYLVEAFAPEKGTVPVVPLQSARGAQSKNYN